jgi:hypothetical protein
MFAFKFGLNPRSLGSCLFSKTITQQNINKTTVTSHTYGGQTTGQQTPEQKTGQCAAATPVAEGNEATPHINTVRRTIWLAFFCSFYDGPQNNSPPRKLMNLVPNESCDSKGSLRHCATSRKVAGSIPDGAIGIFH